MSGQTVTVTANGQEKVIDYNEDMTVIVHQGGIKVGFPGSREITPRTTLAFMAETPDFVWQVIRRNLVFRGLFNELFSNKVTIPETIEELNSGPLDVAHGTGLILEVIDAVILASTNKVLAQYPETYLHPSEQRMLVEVLRKAKDLEKLVKEYGELHVSFLLAALVLRKEELRVSSTASESSAKD